MTDPSQIFEEELLEGVLVIAWPDGRMKADRKYGTITKKKIQKKEG
jgi:hypothetical protein